MYQTPRILNGKAILNTQYDVEVLEPLNVCMLWTLTVTGATFCGIYMHVAIYLQP